MKYEASNVWDTPIVALGKSLLSDRDEHLYVSRETQFNRYNKQYVKVYMSVTIFS